MRIISPIDRPLVDEHVIGVDPPLRPDQPGVWRRRINPFTGRSLSDRALTAEQEARSGIQRLRGQSVTAGVVSGLDILMESGAIGAAPDKAHLQLLPGIGLTQSGEDIVVSSPRSIALGDLPVRARSDILDAIASNADAPAIVAPSGNPDPESRPGGAFAGLYPPLPRGMAKPALGALLTAKAATALPRVAVLVAQPITATILAGTRDACSPDPRDDPYDDLQLIDGVRLLLDFWPSEMVARAAGPDYRLPVSGPTLRNRLAYRIFGVERAMLPGEMHPWEAVGVPLALVGFNQDWTLAFVDRASVVRLGGRPNPRTPLVPQSGNPVLWQARVAQFAEHIMGLEDLSPTTLALTLRQLPPVGFLPIDVIDLATRRQSFFPAGFGLSLAPIPLEQVDLVVSESAALVPINLDIIDEIELLIPVPERVYEPGLLEIAAVDHAFNQAIARAVADRSAWLVRREQVRRRRDILFDGATGARRGWPIGSTSIDEVLPDAQARGPIGCTRVREVTAPANADARALFLAQAGSSLTIDKGDMITMWVKVVDATGLSGFALRLGRGAKGSVAGDFTHAVFWGSPEKLPDVNGNAKASVVRQGDLPPTGVWTRLDIAVDAAWTMAGQPLTDLTIDGLMTAQRGGTIHYGPVSKVDAAGLETVWIGDDTPPGSLLSDTANSSVTGWPFVPAGIGASPDPAEAEFGTIESGGARAAAPLMAFRSRWQDQSFLDSEFKDLDEAGVDGFVRAVEARLKATNDAIDLGFVRARADIYRVRQYMLGADTASRLVTSPALADIAVREESARAKSLDIAAFVQNAYHTDFRRNPDAPLDRVELKSGAPPVATPPVMLETRSAMLFQPNFNLMRATATPFTAIMAAPLGVRAESFSATAAATTVNRTTPVGDRFASQFQDSAVLSLAAVRAGIAGSRRGIDIGDVQFQMPLPSAVERTASVAERLMPSPAVEAHGYAIAGKMAALTAIAGLIGVASSEGGRPLGIALGDLPCPGYRSPPLPTNPADAVPPLDGAPANTVSAVIAELQLRPSQRKHQDLDAFKDSGAGAARHEADYFNGAVRAIDNTIALMRLVEARIDVYNKLLTDARSVRDELMGLVAGADARLRTIDIEIEEARQDVSIATALLAEETQRVDALNARRRAILGANANVVLFRRPRRARRVRPIATAPATAAYEASPIVACRREHPAVPEEINSYVGLLRDAPVAWFPQVHPHLERIDRLDTARAALAAVQHRAQQPPIVFLGMQVTQATPRFLRAVAHSMTAQRALLEQRRQQAVQIDLAAIQAANLANARRVLLEHSAMADMIAADHNRAILAKACALEIEQIGDAAACLHDSFGDTPPVVRLQWAEVLSEYDLPAPLHDLAGLAGWSELPIEMRKTQQGLVDWLFSRVARANPQALTAINELVRICLLMAAHAPVDRIIPARLVSAAPARIGGRLSLFTDVAIARIGMTALVHDQNARLIAHAVIEDINDGVAHTRIVRTYGAIDTITPAMRIHLSDIRLAL